MKHYALLSIALAAAGLVAGCTERDGLTEVEDATPQATVSANTSDPLSQLLSNPCNGDVVAIEGVVHTVFGVHVDQAGGSHLQAHIIEHGSGVGLAAGDKYSFSADTQFVSNTPDPSSETTQVVSVHLVGQGGTTNFLALQVLHFTMNANGQVTALVDKFTSACH
jgi:hypothetical protein